MAARSEAKAPGDPPWTETPQTAMWLWRDGWSGRRVMGHGDREVVAGDGGGGGLAEELEYVAEAVVGHEQQDAPAKRKKLIFRDWQRECVRSVGQV